MKYKDIPPGSLIIDRHGVAWFVYRDAVDSKLKHIPVRTTNVNVSSSLESEMEMSINQRVVDLEGLLKRVMKDENR